MTEIVQGTPDLERTFERFDNWIRLWRATDTRTATIESVMPEIVGEVPVTEREAIWNYEYSEEQILKSVVGTYHLAWSDFADTMPATAQFVQDDLSALGLDHKTE